MNVVIVTPEAAPWSRTGGLGEVLGALPSRLAEGATVSVISPLYRGVDRARLIEGGSVEVPIRTDFRQGRVFRTKGTKALRHWFIEQDAYFDREGIYGTGEGDYADNCERFVFFSRAALEVAATFDAPPDIVHVHDWPTSLIPAYLKTMYAERFPDTKSVLTVHNLAYQGIFWHLDVPLTGLDWGLFNWRQLEFHGKMNLLKAGLTFADAITTVSPSYAREIRTPEFGVGLEGVLAERSDVLAGILNGIDTKAWDPAKDKAIAKPYSAKSMAGKAACKRALQKACGLEVGAEIPLFVMVTRLADQKGIDLVLEAGPELARSGVQLAVLGSGDAGYETRLRDLAAAHPGRIAVTIGYDDEAAHRHQAGGDFLLMPSRYEPCGLTQMCALRYGTIPVVRRTGGLADTVRDGVTGLSFEEFTAAALLEAAGRAVALFGDAKKFAAMRKAGMAEDNSWESSAERYLALYRGLKT